MFARITNGSKHILDLIHSDVGKSLIFSLKDDDGHDNSRTM